MIERTSAVKEPMVVADLTKMLLQAGDALLASDGRQLEQVVLIVLELDVKKSADHLEPLGVEGDRITQVIAHRGGQILRKCRQLCRGFRLETKEIEIISFLLLFQKYFSLN